PNFVTSDEGDGLSGRQPGGRRRTEERHVGVFGTQELADQSIHLVLDHLGEDVLALVAAVSGLPVQVVDHRVDDLGRHQARTGVVEVDRPHSATRAQLGVNHRAPARWTATIRTVAPAVSAAAISHGEPGPMLLAQVRARLGTAISPTFTPAE